MTARAERLAIRGARIEDAARLVELLNEIIAVGGTTAYQTRLNAIEFTDQFLRGRHVLSCHVAVERETERCIGFQSLTSHPDLPAGWGDIATFAQLSPKIPGVGTALFAATRSAARVMGLKAINAAIRADNSGGLAFYDKIGFETYRTLDAVPLQDGTPVDRILKRFDL